MACVAGAFSTWLALPLSRSCLTDKVSGRDFVSILSCHVRTSKVGSLVDRLASPVWTVSKCLRKPCFSVAGTHCLQRAHVYVVSVDRAAFRKWFTYCWSRVAMLLSRRLSPC